MEDIVIIEQTNAEVTIETNAPQGADMSVFAVYAYNTTPADKIELATYIAPVSGESKVVTLQTSTLDKGQYYLEVWSNFGTDSQQQHISEKFTITDSKVL